MKTMGGKKKDQPPPPPPEPEEEFELEVMYDSEEMQIAEELPEKRHKKHKHKKHKKKKASHDTPPPPPVVEKVEPPQQEPEKLGLGHRTPKPSLKLKIKLAEANSESERKSKEKASPPKATTAKTTPQRAVPAKVTPPKATPPKVTLPKLILPKPVIEQPVAGPSTLTSELSPAVLKILANCKKKKGGKGKDSGTSSDEERWLDAIESGKLEEVDDELKKIKDPKLMTARQRAMLEKKTDKEPSAPGEQLMALPSGYKEVVITEEMLQKRALKLQRRKMLAEEKREKDKKKTMDRLLNKQESKATKGSKTMRTLKHMVPQITYRSSENGITISLPVGIEFPLAKMEAKLPPPPRPLCVIQGCGRPKTYACSKTGVPLCSFECYTRNLKTVKI